MVPKLNCMYKTEYQQKHSARIFKKYFILQEIANCGVYFTRQSSPSPTKNCSGNALFNTNILFEVGRFLLGRRDFFYVKEPKPYEYASMPTSSLQIVNQAQLFAMKDIALMMLRLRD